MGHKMNLTDNQWYNFICGLQAGLRLKDLTNKAIDTNIVLKPIGVGGYGKIGLIIPEIVWDGVTTQCLIPVALHDVDISYSGFSCRITWNPNRLRGIKLVDGDFGKIGTHISYNITDGVCMVKGLLPEPNEYGDPVILFFIEATILDTNITVDNPINIELVSGSGYDPNYTTLLKYVKNSQDNKYYLYYITPIENISGAIVSDKIALPDNQKPVGDNKETLVTPSSTGIYIGESCTQPGKKGLVPIIVNVSEEDGFLYDKIFIHLVVLDSSVLFSYLIVKGVKPWKLSAVVYKDPKGNTILNINGVRDIAISDSGTVGYIEYKISNKGDEYKIPLINDISQLVLSWGSE